VSHDNNGNDLPDDAEDWVMVRDNVTGLIWEIKQAKDGVADYENPNDADNQYTWYDTNPANNLGYTGANNDGKNTQAFIEQLNQKQLGGFNDWRMPSPKELGSIANMAKTNPAIDVNFLPTIPSDEFAFYWSSTSDADNTGLAWGVYFNYGNDNRNAKDSSYYVRAVRGGQCWSFDNLVINGDRTITDIASGMMWELETKNTKQTWKNAMDYCENASTAMYTDWRLPEQKEIRTIVNLTRYLPAMNIDFFMIQCLRFVGRLRPMPALLAARGASISPMATTTTTIRIRPIMSVLFVGDSLDHLEICSFGRPNKPHSGNLVTQCL
jgi:hypothetical protein